MAGKGSKPRPLSVEREKFNSEWDRIFGKKGDEKQSDEDKASEAEFIKKVLDSREILL